MRCPDCGSEMEEGSKSCKFCNPDEPGVDPDKLDEATDVGVVYTMNDWLKTKEEKNAEELESNKEEISRKLNERMQQMERHQMEMNLDRLIDSIKGDNKAEYKSRKEQEEAELADNLSRLSEDDFNRLVRELARDKKKEVRSKMKDN